MSFDGKMTGIVNTARTPCATSLQAVPQTNFYGSVAFALAQSLPIAVTFRTFNAKMTVRDFSAGTKDCEDVHDVGDHRIRIRDVGVINDVDAPKSMPCDNLDAIAVGADRVEAAQGWMRFTMQEANSTARHATPSSAFSCFESY